MRIEIFSYWDNCWLRYYKKYFEKKGHEVKIKTGRQFDVTGSADVFIFCWADELAARASRYPLKLAKKYVVFVRSYEIFSGILRKVRWEAVDDVIFVNKMFLKELNDVIPDRKHYIPNAVVIEDWEAQPHQNGFNISVVAQVNHKKGVNLIPQVLSKLVKKDAKYTIHIAGAQQEVRFMVYLKHILTEMEISENCKFYGEIKDVKGWLEDKDYLLVTSVTEGHPNNVLEAMSLGIKPVIHNYYGVGTQFPKEFVWNDIDRAVSLITEDEYNSLKYRNFIEDNYSIDKIYPVLEEVVCSH